MMWSFKKTLFLITVQLVCTAVDSSSVCLQAPKLPSKRAQLYYATYGINPTDPAAMLKCPGGNCIIFGDGRSDYSIGNQYTLDIPFTSAEMASRVSAKDGASIIIPFFSELQTTTQPFKHSGCGKYKIFYEGFSYGPPPFGTCAGLSTSTWSIMKNSFYTTLYDIASDYNCMDVINTDHDAGVYLQTAKLTVCRETLFNGITYWQAVTAPSDVNAVSTVTFYSLDPNKAYVWPICRYVFSSADVMYGYEGTRSPLYYMLKNDKGEILYYNSGEDWTGGANDFTIQCTTIKVAGTSKVVLTTRMKGGRFLPNLLVQFKDKLDQSYPIQVVESKLSDVGDDAWVMDVTTNTWSQEQACNDARPRCQYFKVPQYSGRFGSQRADPYVRRLFSDIGNLDPVMKSYGPVSPYSYSGGGDSWRLMIDDEHYKSETTFQQYSDELGRLADEMLKPEYLLAETYQVKKIQTRLEDYLLRFGLVQREPGNWCGEVATCSGDDCFEYITKAVDRIASGDTCEDEDNSAASVIIRETVYVNNSFFTMLDRTITKTVVVNNTPIYVHNTVVHNIADEPLYSNITQDVVQLTPTPVIVDYDTGSVISMAVSAAGALGGIITWIEVIRRLIVQYRRRRAEEEEAQGYY